jgi:phage terminase large subunit GpA-like protein
LQIVYSQAYSAALRPEPDLTVSEWADRHRVLDQASSSEAGKWRTDRTPYLREIMDSLSAQSPDDIIVFMKGAQIGATEAGNNWLGYVIHHAPGSMLYVMPTADSAKRASKQRIGPMLDSIPEVAAKISAPRARDSGNTLFQKDYAGGTLILTGSNSNVGLRSMPARYLFLDEASSYPSDVDGEGSPVQLAIRRTATFKRNRKVFMVSTPTLDGLCTIQEYFEQSDQRYFYVPCPHCSEFGTITWDRIHWHDNDPTTACLVCEHCGSEISESNKTNMLLAGEWRPTATGRYKGYHLSSLYSPLGWYSWSDAATDFMAAKKGSQEQLKTFINTVLGEVWTEQGQQADPAALIMRREEYPDSLEFKKTTIGIDVQRDRIELEHLGWGEGEESWSIDYVVLLGDTAQPSVWDELAELLDDLAPDSVAIDSGYNTSLVYDFVAKRRFCHAIKGVSGFGLPLIEDAQKRARRLAKRRKKALTAEPIGVDQGKAMVYSMLSIAEPGPGYCHFPADAAYDDEYFAQLTAEKLVTRYSKGRPRQEWAATRARNEALDCRVYALAALRLSQNTRKRPRVNVQNDAENVPKTVQTPPKRRKWSINQQHGGAWL